MFAREELEAAAALVHEVQPPTAQIAWPLLAGKLGCPTVVKHENHSRLGAFKVRGGVTFIDWLKRNHPEAKGVICATRGNHGQSVALNARLAGLECVIVAPKGNSSEKNAAMESLGGELIIHGEDFQESLEYARELAKERNLYPMPSYHPELVRGVATYGYELFTAHPELKRVYVPIGLGSGIIGTIAARDALGIDCEIVGVCSSQALAHKISFDSGQIAESPVETVIGDGLATRTPVPEAMEVIWQKVARVVTVSDEEIAEAMRLYFSTTHNVAEGAGAAPLAAALKEEQSPDRPIGLVLSGGNIDRAVYARVLAGEAVAPA